MEINIIEPLLLGLSSGIFCVAYCAPFMAPYMVFENRNRRENALVLFKFILGRLIGYLIFGAAFGYLGQTINNRAIDFIAAACLTMLSALLVFYSLGLLRERKGWCLAPALKKNTPLAMGLLMGVNICPPFLISLGYVFTRHSWLAGAVYFFIFFCATTVYFTPLFFLGFLNRIAEFRALARLSGVVVGAMFLLYGVFLIIKFLKI